MLLPDLNQCLVVMRGGQLACQQEVVMEGRCPPPVVPAHCHPVVMRRLAVLCQVCLARCQYPVVPWLLEAVAM